MDIGTWLLGLGLGQYEQAFRDNEIDSEVLAKLTADDLKEVGVTAVGHRRKLLEAIEALSAAAKTGPPGVEADAAIPATSSSAQPAAQAERRQITVMFVDLVGSTALSAVLDPEDMREVLAAYQGCVAAEVAKFEGHLAKLMGDGVLAFYGWPTAHENEAERAVRTGLAAVRAVRHLTTPTGVLLAARVGIATGLVVVGGPAGEGAAGEQAVAGEAPNLAARLQAIAPPATVVIADSTRRLLGTAFDLADLGPQSVKGFADPIGAWRVLGEHAVASRFEARSTGRAPLVGRHEEVALLHGRWQQARDGDGQVVLLSGEPGIGKSRITRALYERLDGTPHRLLQHQCSPFLADSSLHPVIEHLEQAAGFRADDPPTARLDKLEALLAEGAGPTNAATPLIATLLSLPLDGRYPPLAGPPQQQREALIEALVERVTGLARRQPVLAVVEDLHWADPTTLELLERLIGRLARERVLLLLTARPDFQPPATCRTQVTLLSLNRLPRRQSAALVAAVAAGQELPDAVQEEIVARADGVPLFIEELTKTVLETAGDTILSEGNRDRPDGTSARPSIPASLQDSLMARLDRLGAAKELAQIGATIGREFAYELLAAVSPLPQSELGPTLDQLVAAELVFVRGSPPAATYSFKHALVQDVAYASLLKSRRQKLHARIARELEERWPQTREQRPELLAHHFAAADLPEKAAAYGLDAGQSAFARSAATEAVAHLQRALDLLCRRPEGERPRRLELDLQITLGQALIAAKGYGDPGVAEAFERARQLVDAAAPARQITVLSGIGAFHYMRSESGPALRVARDILRLARRGEDPTLHVEGRRRIGGAFQQLGRLVPAQRHLEQGLKRFAWPHAPAPDPAAFIVEPHATLLCILTANLLLLGYPDQARARRAEAIEMTRRVAHPLTLASTLHWAALSAFLLREPVALRGWVGEFVAVSAKHTPAHFMQWAQIWHCWLAVEAGGGRESLPQLREALAAHWASGTRFWSPMYTALLADAYRRVGDTDAALEVLADALEQVEQTRQRVYEAELHRLKAAVLLSRESFSTSDAEAALLQALAVASSQQARFCELRAAIDLARLWQGQERRREAHALLAPIFNWFTEGFDTPDLQEAKALLASCAPSPNTA